jgi:hypothetical protein
MPPFDWIYSLVLLTAFAVVLSGLWHEKKAGISPTPVLSWVRRRAVRMLKGQIDPGKVHEVADLGCGWGGMTGILASTYPQAHITGYEISPFPYYASKLRSLFFGKRISIRHDNFFERNLSDCDVVFCYLSPQHMEKLKPQLLGLKPGSLVLSCSFPILGWAPIAQEKVWSLVNIPVFLYRI